MIYSLSLLLIQVLLCYKTTKLRYLPLAIASTLPIVGILMICISDSLIWTALVENGYISLITCLLGWYTWFRIEKKKQNEEFFK